MKGQKKSQTQAKTALSAEYVVPPVPQSPFFYPHQASANPLPQPLNGLSSSPPQSAPFYYPFQPFFSPQPYPRSNTLNVELPEIECLTGSTEKAFLLLSVDMFKEVLSKAHERSPEKDINQLFIKCMPDLIESMKENLKVLLELSDDKSSPSMTIVNK